MVVCEFLRRKRPEDSIIAEFFSMVDRRKTLQRGGLEQLRAEVTRRIEE